MELICQSEYEMYCVCYFEVRTRIGGYLFDSTSALLVKRLHIPDQNQEDYHLNEYLQNEAFYHVLPDVKPGLWIGDYLHSQGKLILELRHASLFLESQFIDGTLEYDKICFYLYRVGATSCPLAVCDYSHMDRTALQDLMSFTDEDEDEYKLKRHAVALQSNSLKGRAIYCAMRGGSNCQVISIRVIEEPLLETEEEEEI